MGLADAGRTEEDDVFSPLDEAELVEALHLLATERRLEGKIKLGEPLDGGQPTGAHRGLQASVVAQLNLRVEQLLDRLGGRERRAIDAVEDRIEGLERARHVQVGEHLPQAIATGRGGAFHASPPVRRAYTASGRFSTVTSGRGAADGAVRRGASGTRSDVYGRGASGVQEQTLVAIESIARPLARRGVHPHIGDVVEPLPALLIEIRIIGKRPPVDEIVAEVAHGTLDLALGLRAVRPTRARREAPVVREAEKLEIAHERATLQPQVARDHRLHLIEEQLLRDAAEIAKRVLESVDQRPHVLAQVKPAPQQPRVAEHDEQGVPHAPRKRESREVDLRLAARRRLEADHRLRRRRRPDLTDKLFQLRVTAGKSRRADLRQQPHRGQLPGTRRVAFR